MKQIEKKNILKVITILLLLISIPCLLFYLGFVVQEYCACDETMYEGQKGINIWGDMFFCEGIFSVFHRFTSSFFGYSDLYLALNYLN